MSVTADSIPEILAARHETIAEFCRRHSVQRLALFGSMLTGHTRRDSDVDLLVEFVPGHRVSLFGLGGMITELSDLLGRPVDLRTPEDLSPYFRQQVLQTAKTLYAA
jgi:predicted nucleotidyltransferase